MTVMVTGGLGCIGAWALYHLVQQGQQPICFDLSQSRHRLDLLMDREQQQNITFAQGDLTDFNTVKSAFETYGVDQVIHLAALQVPACKSNPVLGAQVNVVGSTNIFEAALQSGLNHIAYASSIAIYGPPDVYDTSILPPNAPKLPRTLYGVYKVALENMADVYWRDYELASTGLRPYTVYGLGRDQGLTSAPTKAMESAANGSDYLIPFGGNMQFHLASDVALQFIAASQHSLKGAHVFALGTPPIAVQAVANLIMEIVPEVTIRVDETRLAFPEGCDPAPLHAAFEEVYETALEAGIRQTIDGFKRART